MNIKNMLLTALWVAGMAACGGGTAVGPTLPSAQAQLDNLNAKYDSNSNQPTSAAVPGASTESIQSIFMDELTSGAEEIVADVVTYYQKSFFLKNAIEKAQMAYGDSIVRDLNKSIDNLKSRTDWLDRCMLAMEIDTPKALIWKNLQRLSLSYSAQK
jgi:hypothetical protein